MDRMRVRDKENERVLIPIFYRTRGLKNKGTQKKCQKIEDGNKNPRAGKPTEQETGTTLQLTDCEAPELPRR